MRRMSREDPQLKIRLPADLKERIESASKTEGRSMNAEIIARLENSFDASASFKKAELGALINELMNRFPPDQVLISIGGSAKARIEALEKSEH